MKWYGWLLLVLLIGGVLAGTIVPILQADRGHTLTVISSLRSVDAILVRDLQHNTQAFSCGDLLELSYIGNGSGPVRWEYQVTGASNAFVTMLENTKDNPIRWKIPDSIFGKVVFRVSSIANLNIRATSPAYTIAPVITWTGVGDIAQYHFVTVGDAVVFQYSLTGDWLKQAKLSLQYSSDRGFKTWTAVADNALVLDLTHKSLTWTVDIPSNIYKLRLVTTNLVNKGFPNELQYTFPQTVGVQDEVSFNTTGDFCTVVVEHASGSGRKGAFAPGESVTLKFTEFSGSLPVHDWYYSNSTVWTKFLSNSATDSDTWVIPNHLDGTVSIRAVSMAATDDVTHATPDQYGEAEINIGVYMILRGDATHKTAMVDYQGSTNGIISQAQVYIVGYTTTNVLNDQTATWTLGWLTNPNEASLESRIHRLAITHIDVVTGDPLPKNVALISLSYLDNGQDLSDTVKSPGIPLYLQANLPLDQSASQNRIPVSLTSQTLYTFKK